ncbi:MAG: type II secretion system GspH family protein [Synergistetes bacterium]|nr:type II secretion system GspH family protein [Synergistota bacterium]MCX8128257.1 type II secretion system GspH family protein [Synergistota bacterium]MDW8192704.1 type II secretion system protein [Synergistota bacterium]
MKRGFSLVEALIAVAMVVIGILALYSLFYAIEFSGQKEKSRFVMLKLAEGKLEEVMYGLADTDIPGSLPTRFTFTGTENNFARLPSYYPNSIKEDSVYNGIFYCCLIEFITSSVNNTVLIKVKVWERDRPSRFVEIVGARQK